MNRFLFSQDIQPLSGFRAHVAAFIQQVRKTNRPMVITHHGKSAVVLMNVAEYEALLEKLEILQDIHHAEQEIQQGKGIPHETAKKMVLSRLKTS